MSTSAFPPLLTLVYPDGTYAYGYSVVVRNKIYFIPGNQDDVGVLTVPLCTCSFSGETSGNHSVPAPGCTLSQMVTVSGGTMNVSGVAGASPLHELAAVGGTPTFTQPKRHFHVIAGGSLTLRYLELTGGRVYTVYDGSQTTWYTGGTQFGGTVMVEGAGARLDVFSSVFSGCGGAACAYYGGAVFARETADVVIHSSTFQSCTAESTGGRHVGGKWCQITYRC